MTAIGSVDGGATVADYGEVIDPGDYLTDVVALIVLEIVRQDEKWGVRDHDLGFWQLIATEEDGEAAEAILKGRFADAERELVQAMAVRLRMIEKVRRMAKGGVMGRKAYEAFTCSCGERCQMIPHERTGGLAPITMDRYDSGNVELVQDEESSVLWRIVPEAERESRPRPRRLNHYANCPDAGRFRK